jgi:hypothetical protein
VTELTFSNPILLGGVNASSLANNTLGFKKDISPGIHQFQTIVTPNNWNNSRKLSLDFQNTIWNNIKDFGFVFHHKNPDILV